MKKIWKIIKILAAAGLAVFLLSLLVVVTMSRFQRQPEHADAALVLGAAINTPALYNRSLEGLRLYQEGRVDRLILSGGRISSKYISEAESMRKTILSKTSSSPEMILEQESHSTYENIVNSKKLASDVKSVVIVSDSYHLARGVVMAKAAGFDQVYWSAPDTAGYYPTDELFFHYLREAVAMIAYLPKFLFH